ncbi:hypothetical protein, partial [Salmonella enterica]|uniref:hypothetical protein n=1 Tax=Salmonella enterica TaxID=28901 RepID=UPI000AFBB16E
YQAVILALSQFHNAVERELYALYCKPEKHRAIRHFAAMLPEGRFALSGLRANQAYYSSTFSSQ